MRFPPSPDSITYSFSYILGVSLESRVWVDYIMDEKRMKIFIAFMLSLAIVLALLVASGFLSPATTLAYNSFEINGEEFNITYVATNETQLMHGLMNTTITNKTIMLFVFKELGNYPFWMYDTYSNLDIIWINYAERNGTIVYIAKNATSCFVRSECVRYNPGTNTNYVIEAKAGFVERNNISVGDRIILR